MNLITVENLTQPDLAIYRYLRDNASTQDNSFIADSPKVVNMLLKSHLQVRSLLATQEYYERNAELIATKAIPKLYVADRKLMESIVGHKVHHNVMMHGVRPAESELADLGNKIVMVDLISKTENVGAIIRSAAALGVNSMVLPKNGPHPYGRRALRVSMGHASMLQFYQYDNIIETIRNLRQSGYRIFAIEVTQSAIELSRVNIPEKWVAVMGNEGEGLSKEVIEACDEAVTIEMVEGVKSFNVAVAASIVMYHFSMRSV